MSKAIELAIIHTAIMSKFEAIIRSLSVDMDEYEVYDQQELRNFVEKEIRKCLTIEQTETQDQDR